MKTKKTDNKKKSDKAGFRFPCRDFQKMAEMSVIPSRSLLGMDKKESSVPEPDLLD